MATTLSERARDAACLIGLKPASKSDQEHLPIPPLDEAARSEIIEMALSDHTSFEHIQILYGLSPDEVKALMRANLKSGSYRAWRKRVRDFSDRRAHYK